MQEREELIVDGFQFGTKSDVEVARNEQQKIKMLEARMDYANREQVYTIYNKAIENRVFKTPIGYAYLKKLQDFLYSNPIEGKIVMSIPLYMHYGNTVRENPEQVKPRIKLTREKKEPIIVKLQISVFLNVFLVILIGAMFFVTLTADNPNMINYENALVNKYSKWEEQLKEREALVREKEKELDLSEK